MPVTGPDSCRLAVTLLNERIASSYRLGRIGYVHKDSTSHVISDSLMVMHLTKRYRKDEESVLPRRRSIQILAGYNLP